jgi:hypothetical protein
LDVVECKIPAFLIAQFGHPLQEIRIMWGVSRLHTDKADAQHLRLLGARRERPRGRAAEQRDELAPFQLTKLHALTPAKVTAYWIGEHQVRGLPPCGILVRHNDCAGSI